MFAISDMTVEIHCCPRCGSEEVSRNGQTRHRTPKLQMSRMWPSICSESRVESYYERTTGVNAADAA